MAEDAAKRMDVWSLTKKEANHVMAGCMQEFSEKFLAMIEPIIHMRKAMDINCTKHKAGTPAHKQFTQKYNDLTALVEALDAANKAAQNVTNHLRVDGLGPS